MRDRERRISVCVFTRDRAGHLRKTLAALVAVLPPQDDDIEIVVVDNASLDDTAAVIAAAARRDRRIRYLFEPYGGVARARNTAFRFSRGSIIACIDDDVRPLDGWLEALTAPIATGIADAVAGRIVLAGDSYPPWLTKFFRVRLGESLTSRESHAPLISANMAVSAEVAASIQFDEELGPGQLGMSDDLLFDYQIQVAGFRIVGSDAALVVHEFDMERLERQAILDLARANGRSDAYVWRHWLHSDLRWLRLRLGLAAARWLAVRLTAPGTISEGVYQTTYQIEFLRRLRLERRRRARYPDDSARDALGRNGRQLRSGGAVVDADRRHAASS
jgi:glucosyl-dolichyl phosphate glucuronosyltransferase